MVVTVEQVFSLEFNQTLDATAVVGDEGFHSSHRKAAASALGRQIEDIEVISMNLGDARRLRRLNAVSGAPHQIIFRYYVNARSYPDMNATVAAMQTFAFITAYKERLIVEEEARASGLKITRFVVERNTATSGGQSAATSFNRTALGGVLAIYASPGSDIVAIRDWAEKAAKALQAALVKILAKAVPSLPASSLAVETSVGSVSLTSSYAHIQLDMFAAVPPYSDPADDVDGSKYQARAQLFSQDISGLPTSPEFPAIFEAELSAIVLPVLPGMSYAPSSYAEPASYEGSAASGTVIAIILIVVLIVAFSCYWAVQCKRRPSLRRLPKRLCIRYCPYFREKLALATSDIKDVEEIVVCDDHVKEFVGSPKGDQQNLCICGNHLARAATFCGECGRDMEDIARERYVETRTHAELRGTASAVDDFDVPSSPKSVTSGMSLKSLNFSSALTEIQKQAGGSLNFLSLVGAGAVKSIGGIFDIEKVKDDLEEAHRMGHVASDASEAPGHEHRKHSYLGDNADRSDARHQLKLEATKLRMGLGAPQAHALQPTHQTHGSLASTALGSTSASMQEPETPTSWRMIESFRAHNTGEVTSPQKTPIRLANSFPPNATLGRPGSSGTQRTQTTTGSEEMEIIEVSSSDDEKEETTRSNSGKSK
jgi:hypothetical protein